MSQYAPIHLVANEEIPKIISQKIFENKKNQPAQVILKPIIDKLINDNYLESSIDSIINDTIDECQKAYLHLGPKYSFSSLTFDSLSEAFIKRLKLKVPNNTEQFHNLREGIKDYYGDNGYPFCKIHLDNLGFENENILGHLNIQTGPQIIIDSIQLNGDLKIRQGYIEKYLDYQKGEPYNHKKLIDIKSQIDRLTFLKQEKSPDLSFYYDHATLNLFLEPKNSSRFDLLFGVIPTNSIANRQLFLSLDFTAEMLNKIGLGEYIFINFERLRPEQQKLQVEFNYPYLLNLPFALDTKFSIFRNALNYSTLQSDLGIQYLFSNRDYIKMSWNYESSDLIEVDTSSVRNSMSLPDDLDVSQTGIALEFFMNRLDYKFNPRSGFLINIRALVGEKTIKKNPLIFQLESNEFDFSTIYDELKLKTSRFEINTTLSYFYPLAARAALGLHVKGGWKYSPVNSPDQPNLYRNEKYQIGGNQILRGFDEASIFTGYYAISTLEYRLLLSSNSYFSVPFIDLGLIELENGDTTIATGIGGSLGLETKVGLFNFSIAVGRTSELSFDIGRPKAHFGFISLF